MAGSTCGLPVGKGRASPAVPWFAISVCLCVSLGGAIFGYTASSAGIVLTSASFVEQFCVGKFGDYDTCFGTSHVEWDTYLSIFVAANYAGALVGSLLSFILNDHLGRKTTVQLAGILYIASLLFLVRCTTIVYVIVSRLCVGVFVGILSCVCPVYASEVAPKEYRGRLGLLFALSISVSLVISIVSANPFMTTSDGWRYIMGFGTIIGLALVIPMCFFPESPRWLLSNGTPSEAMSSLTLLRGGNFLPPELIRHMPRTIHSQLRPETRAEILKEFTIMQKALEEEANMGGGWKELLSQPTMRYRLAIGVVLQIGQQLTSSQLIISYGSEMFAMIGVHDVFIGIFIIYLMGFLGTVLCVRHVDTLGRRATLIQSTAGVSLCLLGAIVCLNWGHLTSGYADLYGGLSYVLMFVFGACLAGTFFFYSYGIGPISWVIPSEIFPMRLRSKAASTCILVHAIAACLSSTYTLRLVDTIGLGNTMLVFVSISGFVCMYVYFFLPETKDLSLEQMECVFRLIDPDETGNMCCSRAVGVQGQSNKEDLKLLLGRNSNDDEEGLFHEEDATAFLTPVRVLHDTKGGAGAYLYRLSYAPSAPNSHKYQESLRNASFEAFDEEATVRDVSGISGRHQPSVAEDEPNTFTL